MYLDIKCRKIKSKVYSHAVDLIKTLDYGHSGALGLDQRWEKGVFNFYFGLGFLGKWESLLFVIVFSSTQYTTQVQPILWQVEQA